MTLATASLLLLCASALRGVPDSTTLTLSPGYTVGLPAGYCVERSKGPDFVVLYVRDQAAPKKPVLAGIYGGHNPRQPECANGKTRQWTANGLSFKSARGSEGCAEFLVQDGKSSERGFLHLWFGPAAKDHSQLAESLIASVHPAPMPVNPSEPPACK